MSTTRTRAKRKLVPERVIKEVLHRTELGVTLNAAVKIVMPEMSNVAAIRLVQKYLEYQQCKKEDNEILAERIYDSLFPSWVEDEQPEYATYIGVFPYGHWSIYEH